MTKKEKSKAKDKDKVKKLKTATKSKDKKSKKPKLRLAKPPKDKKPGVGHNSGEKIAEGLVAIFDQYEQMEATKKEISKAQRDLRADAKDSFGIHSSVFNHEVKLRKMESDVRVQFETGHADLKDMLGYQFALPLNEEHSDEERDTTGEAGHDDGSDAAERLASA